MGLATNLVRIPPINPVLQQKDNLISIKSETETNTNWYGTPVSVLICQTRFPEPNKECLLLTVCYDRGNRLSAPNRSFYRSSKGPVLWSLSNSELYFR